MSEQPVNTDQRDQVVDREVPQVIEEGPSLPQLLNPEFVERFERGIDIYKRWVAACYKLTRETHWINHGTLDTPKYSLQGPGAEALMNPLAISFERPETRLENVDDETGKFYCYWVEGYMESKTLGRRGYYLGYCDSRDPFFNARPGWKPETGHGDVRKSATTNWIVNGVTRIAGLRDPDPELLKKAGLDAQRIQHIDYRGGKTMQQSNESITLPQLKRLWAKCKTMQVSEQTLLEKLVKVYQLEDMPNSDDAVAKVIKRKDYDKLCDWADRGGKDGNGGRVPGQEG